MRKSPARKKGASAEQSKRTADYLVGGCTMALELAIYLCIDKCMHKPVYIRLLGGSRSDSIAARMPDSGGFRAARIGVKGGQMGMITHA